MAWLSAKLAAPQIHNELVKLQTCAHAGSSSRAPIPSGPVMAVFGGSWHLGSSGLLLRQLTLLPASASDAPEDATPNVDGALLGQ